MRNDRSHKEPRREENRDHRRTEDMRRAESKGGDKPQHKPSKIERREWRGAGVCGDRHTD